MKTKIYFLYMIMVCTSMKVSANTLWALICPEDVTVDCNADLSDLSIYGDAVYHDQNGYHSAGTPTVTYNLSSCGSGTIKRKWVVEDPYWNLHTCTQIITVGSGSTLSPEITWPAMVTLEGCNPNTHPDATGKPTWVASECHMLGHSYKDALYTVSADCKKILRKWTVIDWCMNSTGNMPTWTFTQTIKIVNAEPPTFTCVPDITVKANDCKNGKVTSPKLNIDPSSCGGNYEILNNSLFATEKSADLSGSYPVGTTKVIFTVKYGCGQKKTCTTNVTVKPKSPVPVCIGSLTVALMGIDTDSDGINDQGMVDIWAKDLNWKSESTCGYSPLRYSFTPNPADMKKTFTCDEIGKNTVKMYVTDTKGAQSYCEVVIDIQNNGANIKDCKPKPKYVQSRFMVAGKVSNLYGEGIKGAALALNKTDELFTVNIKYDTTKVIVKDSFKNLSGYWVWFYEQKTTITQKSDTIHHLPQSYSFVTDDKGSYLSDTVMLKTKDYALQCKELALPLAHVDKNDIDLLTSYLLGQEVLKENWQKIAADVDQNKKIDIEDLNLMIKYVKGEITTFGKNYIMVCANNPLINSHEMLDVIKNQDGVNFTAIEMGDINHVKSTLQESELATDVRSSHIKNSVMAYPNPFFQNLQFEIVSTKDQVMQVKLYDLSGRVILSQKQNLLTGVNNLKIDGDKMDNGLYFYQIKFDQEIFSGKLQKIE